MSDWLERLSRELPADVITTDAGDLAEYGHDWTKVYTPNPRAIALPRSTQEVATIVKIANELAIPLVPSGGRTGLAGGAVAKARELVISLSRMRAMEDVDTLGSTVRVQAGAITEAVHQHCRPHGLTWPVDFASKGSSQVGGNIATNAGGVKVIRYGLTRQWVLGLEVVLASGEVLDLGGALEKNNTGIDLRQLFIGSFFRCLASPPCSRCFVTHARRTSRSTRTSSSRACASSASCVIATCATPSTTSTLTTCSSRSTAPRTKRA